MGTTRAEALTLMERMTTAAWVSLVIVVAGAVLAVAAQRDVAGVELEAADLSHSCCRAAEDLARQVDDAATARTLGMNVLVDRFRLDDVVRREATVEVDVAEHSRRRKTVQGAVDRRTMDARVAQRDLIENLFS